MCVCTYIVYYSYVYVCSQLSYQGFLVLFGSVDVLIDCKLPWNFTLDLVGS